jgi:hypothetical protein
MIATAELLSADPSCPSLSMLRFQYRSLVFPIEYDEMPHPPLIDYYGSKIVSRVLSGKKGP